MDGRETARIAGLGLTGIFILLMMLAAASMT